MPAGTPIATYRLQLTANFDFDAATAIVPYLKALGIASENIVFSSDTSEEQAREFGKGRGTVDCCYPVKAMSGHYGELIFGQKNKIQIILSPMIHSLPSILQGHVVDTVTCTRVMAGPENIKAGFMKERDIFGENKTGGEWLDIDSRVKMWDDVMEWIDSVCSLRSQRKKTTANTAAQKSDVPA